VKVKVENIITHPGFRLLDTVEYEAYGALLQGDETQARGLLHGFHYKQYWTGIRNITTGEYVAKVYRERGTAKPSSYADSDPEIVAEAVNRRVDDHIANALDIIENGCRELPLGVREGDRVRLWDGHNRAALLAAMGHEAIEVRT